MAKDKTLGRLTRLAQEDNDPGMRRFAAIHDARLAGHSWRQIGDALGVSAQAAQEFYARRASA